MTGRFANGRALLVGIADYSYLKKLPATVINDAEDMAQTLRSADHCGYPADRVRLLRDGEASVDALKTAIADFSSACGPEDTAILMFSGHGERIGTGPGSGSYLCPVNFDPFRPASTGISRDDLSGMLAAIRARRLLVILDACHSAGSVIFKAGGSAVETKAGFSNADFDKLGRGAGRVLFASSRENEYSMILGGMRNSLFTHHVLEGLRGGKLRNADGTVGVLDLFKYVSGAVTEKSQHPVMKADNLEGNFPIALAGTVTPRAVRKSAALQDDTWWSRFEVVAVELYPTGPQDQELWSRAGGNIAVLRPNLNGRASWHAALRMLKLGGGGDVDRMIETMMGDFPSNPRLLDLAF